MADKEKLEQLQDQAKSLTEKWKRALADYQNLEKRVEKEKQEFVKYSTASLIDKLLEVLDDLERAEKHLQDKGLSLALEQFRSILEAEGVEEIEALDKEFNPETMDCSEMVAGEKNKVIEVIQKGYYLNDKVLRPAKVKVGKGG
jgi:molecular chaperone GrpE